MTTFFLIFFNWSVHVCPDNLMLAKFLVTTYNCVYIVLNVKPLTVFLSCFYIPANSRSTFSKVNTQTKTVALMAKVTHFVWRRKKLYPILKIWNKNQTTQLATKCMNSSKQSLPNGQNRALIAPMVDIVARCIAFVLVLFIFLHSVFVA